MKRFANSIFGPCKPHWRTTSTKRSTHIIGIAIAIPCVAARPDSPWLAFGLASLSGLTEPLGAIMALTVLQVNADSMGNWLCFVASIMMSVSLWELFPEAWRNATIAPDGGVKDEKGKMAFWIGTALGCVIMLGSDAVLDQSVDDSSA